MRGSPAVVRRPNDAGVLRAVPTPVKFTSFRTLKASRRNCILTWSLTTKFLNSARSVQWRQGPRTTLRGALPNVLGAGAANAPVLNHWSIVFGPSGLPTRSGRRVTFPKEFDVLVA